MNISRPNFMWPVLIIGVGIMMLMISADVIPEAYGDLLVRAWPVLLIIFGLNVMLGGRLKYANWGILGLAIVLVVVIGNLAYAQRQDEYRTDYRESWAQQVNVETIQVEIVAKETQVTLSHHPSEPQLMQAFFEGSTESDVEISFDMETTPPTFRVIEDRPGILPKLDALGRGRLDIFLPSGVQIESLTYTGDDGSVTFNLDQLNVRRVDVEVKRGNMDLCLPFSAEGINSRIFGDEVQVNNGNLRVYVPENITVNLGLDDPDRTINFIPDISRSDYGVDTLTGGSLQTRAVLDNAYDIVFNTVVDGSLTIDHENPCRQE